MPNYNYFAYLVFLIDQSYMGSYQNMHDLLHSQAADQIRGIAPKMCTCAYLDILMRLAELTILEKSTIKLTNCNISKVILACILIT